MVIIGQDTTGGVDPVERQHDIERTLVSRGRYFSLVVPEGACVSAKRQLTQRCWLQVRLFTQRSRRDLYQSHLCGAPNDVLRASSSVVVASLASKAIFANSRRCAPLVGRS